MEIDSNKVRMTGENSFLRLSQTPEGSLTAEISHWRVDLSPLGRGHVLFAKHALGDSVPAIYADNVAPARWRQETVAVGDWGPCCARAIANRVTTCCWSSIWTAARPTSAWEMKASSMVSTTTNTAPNRTSPRPPNRPNATRRPASIQ